jgi:hypothetical protein
MSLFKEKYLKYKQKYLDLQNNLKLSQYGGVTDGDGKILDKERDFDRMDTIITTFYNFGYMLPILNTVLDRFIELRKEFKKLLQDTRIVINLDKV